MTSSGVYALTSKIVLVDYDPMWVDTYKKEVNLIASALGDLALRIHHIGSTAIPGTCAKPIIDILVEATKIENIDSRNTAMIDIGYEPKGEFCPWRCISISCHKNNKQRT